MFSQILQVVSRDRFEETVKKHEAERYARGGGQQLRPLRSDDVLPVRRSQIVARDHRRTASQRRQADPSGLAGGAGAVAGDKFHDGKLTIVGGRAAEGDNPRRV